MSHEQNLERAPAKMRRSVMGILLITLVLATLATFLGARAYFERLERDTALNRMDSYQRALNETLRQHQHLPFVLASDPRNARALQPGQAEPEINARLHRLAQEAQLEAIYLMDDTGRVVATSNAGQPHSFLGQTYGFRPYFQDALQGRRSDYFAIGATSGRPGYFVAEPVVADDGRIKGVIAIKLDVSELQASWETTRERVVALNEDRIVVLASNPDWLYRPVDTLEPELRAAILQSRQFGAEPLEPLAWSAGPDGRAVVDGADYLLASGPAEWRNWTVHFLQPSHVILRKTLVATAFFGSIITCLLGFATFLRSRRIEMAYTASERRRTELVRTNKQLEHAQTELARSAKLAALGHLAASVTHELGQPISAFRNHLAAAEMGGEIRAPDLVADNGHGLADADLTDLQEPFFSTKPSGVGMGLGLAIATEIIKDHGGTLTLGDASEGATFVVSLPYDTDRQNA